MPKPVLHFEDPSAAQLHWDYDRVPVSAFHEAMKLLVEARRLLPLVKCPALVVLSKKDRVVDVAGAMVAFERIASARKEFVLTEQSGHALTLDSDWKVTAEVTHQFISEYSQSRK